MANAIVGIDDSVLRSGRDVNVSSKAEENFYGTNFIESPKQIIIKTRKGVFQCDNDGLIEIDKNGRPRGPRCGAILYTSEIQKPQETSPLELIKLATPLVLDVLERVFKP